ncbi:MAG: nickel-dependent hydrogenase large subunit [Candidatus Krumholzibacteriota bacterium]|nr:nickel-dependent hydrogenase large subunit [Candidatus Krumholzibacteriota bacterium]
MVKKIPIGPFHPILEEPEFFELHVDGERVVDIDMTIGWSHRGIEILSEHKTWDQVPFLVERVCGICSCSHPYAYVKAVEDLLQIEVPERAQYIRAIVAELERLHSHLLWTGLAGHFIGYNTVFMWTWKYREPVLDILEAVTGNRNHYAMMRIGGVRRELPVEEIGNIRKMLDDLEEKNKLLTGAIVDDPVIHARTEGVGILGTKMCRLYGALGPTARAGGYDIDARRDHPIDAYGKLDFDVIVCKNGDVYDKAVVRQLENFEAIKIIRQSLDRLEALGPGEICTEIGEVPAGEGIGVYEAPRGEVLHYIRSDGGNMPMRHKIRAPSFNNILTNEYSVVGDTVADAGLITAAVDPCYSCTERVGRIDMKSGERMMLSEGDLIRMSQEKTEEIRKMMTGR